MFSPEALSAWFRVAVFITLIAAGLLVVVPRDSAEFVVTVLTISIGLVFLALLIVLARRAK